MSRRTIAVVVAGLAATVISLLTTAPAFAHGFSSVAYVKVTGDTNGRVQTILELEYDLFVVSTADTQKNDALFRAGTAAFEEQDTPAQAEAVNKYPGSTLKYLTDRFSVRSNGRLCTASPAGGFSMETREGVPYAAVTLDWTCPDRAGAHQVRSSLFSDDEGYVKGTKTIVTYQIDGHAGSAALDSAHPSFSTAQTWYQRFGEFFKLGAEHLLTGIDHILFLLALIAGSRRPREIVLAATSFTLAHSVTFMLAALGLVDVPARVVEPIIALSIAVVAGWHLWRLWRRGDHATDLETHGGGHFTLDRAGWTRLGVVFCFGLVHGLGFAGALGINEAFSWTLLWSLLVFNVGIETVQLTIIAIVFPLLIVLRRRSPRAGLWATGVIAAGVTVMGLIWFFQRVFAS
jgi:hypothetical protein